MRYGGFRGSVDPRTACLGLRSNGDLGLDITTLAGRTRVDPATLLGAGTIHVLHFGQSNNNNVVFGGPYVPDNPLALFNMSVGHEGAVFVAQEPLLSSDDVKSHNGFQLADQMVTHGIATKAIVSNVSIGGSFAASWAPGAHNTGAGLKAGHVAYRIGLAQRCIENAGLDGVRTVIDWAQGEWDSGSPGITSQADYQTAMAAAIADMKATRLLRPGRVLFVHKCTRPGDTTEARAAIRAGQAFVVDGGLVRAGIDMDAITTGRYTDGTHFTLPGAATLAAGKRALIAAWIAEG